MSKKSKRQEENDQYKDNIYAGIVKRVIWMVILFSFALVFFLSLIGYAGELGININKAARPLFGWGVWIFPFVLALISLFIIGVKEKRAQLVKIIASTSFILVYSALLNLQLPVNKMFFYINKGQGGGYIGFILSYPLLKLTGFWVSLIILSALGIIFLLLMFETKLFKLGRFLVWLIYQLPIGGFWGLKNKLRAKLKSEPEFIETVLRKRDIEDSDGFSKINIDAKQSEELSHLNDSGHKTADSDYRDHEELNRSMVSRYRRKIDIPLNLLNRRIGIPSSGDVNVNKEKIKKTLDNFSIAVEMGATYTGPTVTQYTLRPEQGVKLSQITALNNDLALALAAHPIRIEAPIPGKSLVGIEVPNSVIATVGLREILQSVKFREERQSNLTFAIGKDVAGEPYIADLECMPHLLIAGATGSGKSVCINEIIISLLYQNSPDDLKFILIDPKRVELSIYNGIPHLLTPVITDAKKTINALKWSIAEMERRYYMLSSSGERNIESYNAKEESRLPYIIIIIDELADLMSIAAREVEALIVRLAQMARAVGIHLVLATQRPSVNVITGLIKANITARIAFAVASQIDSRTILDSAGAEKLLGRGDMLFITAELSKPKRLQGAYIDEREIKRVVKFLKSAAEPDYLAEVIERKDGFNITGAGTSLAGAGFSSDETGDELLDEARELIIKTGKASASYLQRHLRIGYARAARILDLLEAEGVIGKGEGAKPRQVLIGKSIESDESDI